MENKNERCISFYIGGGGGGGGGAESKGVWVETTVVFAKRSKSLCLGSEPLVTTPAITSIT